MRPDEEPTAEAAAERDPALAEKASLSRIRSARREDRAAIGDAIGRAFFDDPIALYLFPSETSRRKRFGRFAELAIDSFAGHAAVYTTDPVRGAAHFHVDPSRGLEILAELRKRLPGYAVPSYVREVAGEPHKVEITADRSSPEERRSPGRHR